MGNNPFIPVVVPRRIYENFDPAIQRFIQERVRHGEAVILEGEVIREVDHGK